MDEPEQELGSKLAVKRSAGGAIAVVQSHGEWQAHINILEHRTSALAVRSNLQRQKLQGVIIGHQQLNTSNFPAFIYFHIYPSWRQNIRFYFLCLLSFFFWLYGEWWVTLVLKTVREGNWGGFGRKKKKCECFFDYCVGNGNLWSPREKVKVQGIVGKGWRGCRNV